MYIQLPFQLPEDLSKINQNILTKEEEVGTFNVYICTSTPCYPKKGYTLPNLHISIKFTDKDLNTYSLVKEEYE